MKMSVPALALILAVSAFPQKLETQSPDATKVVRVETARDHLTVIELSEPVAMVAMGNQNAFNVERRDNKVFVTPVDEESRTNLFIWTASGRYSYELIPAKSVEQMHFAIDQAKRPVVALTPAPPPAQTDPATQLPAGMLTEAQPVLPYGERDHAAAVEILLRDVYRDQDRCYLRYTIINRSQQAYRPGVLSIAQLAVVKSPLSLVPLAGHQLSAQLEREIRARAVSTVEVTGGEQPETVAAMSQRSGWISFRLPGTTLDRSLLRVSTASGAAPVTATLVLGRGHSTQEVAHGRIPVD